MGRSLVFAFTVVVAVASATPLSGCYVGPTMTPAEVKAAGTRSLPGHHKAEVVKATSLALRSLGYQVIAEDGNAGRVKTAPKPMVIHAVGGGGYATAVTSEIAWDVEIEGEAGGARVRAMPRAISAGQIYEGNWDAAYATKAIDNVYSEIQANLGGVTRTTAADESTAKPAKKSAKPAH